MEPNMSKPGMKRKRQIPASRQLKRVKVSAWIIYHKMAFFYLVCNVQLDED